MSKMEQALRDEIAWLNGIAARETAPLLDIDCFVLGVDVLRARLAALTAALPAPGDAGDWVMVPRVATEAMCSTYVPVMGVASEGKTQADKVMNSRRAIWVAMLSAAPHPPVSLGEISQAQAQALREALERLLPSKLCGESWDLPDADRVAITITFGALRQARTALSASPLPAPATPGGPDAE